MNATEILNNTGINPLSPIGMEKNLCYVDCDTLKNTINNLQDAYNNVEIILFLNIMFFVSFYLYIILKERNLIKENYLEYYFIILRYYSVLVFAFDLFYFILFII